MSQKKINAFFIGLLVTALTTLVWQSPDQAIAAETTQSEKTIKKSQTKIATRKKLKIPKELYLLEGIVVKVSDGDTVTLLDAQKKQHKIRLAEIDAPESKQAFGTIAKQILANLVFNKKVTAKCSQQDMYRRHLCYLVIDKQEANLILLQKGLAWAYTQYPVQESYLKAQTQAQEQKVGLWQDQQAQAPWDWRKQKKAANAASSKVKRISIDFTNSP